MTKSEHADRARALAWMILTFGVVALSGCNTMEGFGQDLQDWGERMERKANERSGSDQSAPSAAGAPTEPASSSPSPAARAPGSTSSASPSPGVYQ